MKRITASALIGAGALLLGAGTAQAADTAPVYQVKQEGLTADQGAKLADAFGIKNALQDDGAFTFVGDNFANVPLLQIGTGKDEAGRKTVSQSIDRRALAQLRPISAGEARERAAQLLDLADLSPDLRALPSVSNAKLTLSDRAGKPTSETPIDTSVSYNLELGGLPATGQGAKLRITFAPRRQRDPALGHAAPARARQAGADHLPRRGAEGRAPRSTPTTSARARRRSATCCPRSARVKHDLPDLHVQPVGGTARRPTARSRRSRASARRRPFKASRAGDRSSRPPTPPAAPRPYSYKWSSSTTMLDENEGSKIAYKRAPRDGKLTGEGLTLEVIDANGLTTTATGRVRRRRRLSTAASTPGGGGFGKLAIGPTDVGIEQTVDEWQCAQDTAIGFKNVMASHGRPDRVRLARLSAWEKDFKKVSPGGNDTTYADNVDAMWYTGHGNSGGFTFKNSARRQLDHPVRRRLGQRRPRVAAAGVLPGAARHQRRQRLLRPLGRRPSTACTCSTASTPTPTASAAAPAGASPSTCSRDLGGTRPALTVRNAWAQMAFDKEPNGVVFRSMGNIGPNGVTNISDYFWGQGPTGPDIRLSGRSGMWSITGTV